MKVIVARDWVVVIADGDRAQLASKKPKESTK